MGGGESYSSNDNCNQDQLKKPVLYLYPEESTDVTVKVNFKKTKFSCVYPKFNEMEHSWKVRALPNGEILISDKKYPYLFWEAYSYKKQDLSRGFIVKAENAEKFLEKKLELLGLDNKESTDFITFWLPVLIKNKLSLCTFQTQQFFEDLEYNITPKPKTFIRIFLSIKKLDKEIKIKKQELKRVKREGFTVVEWGGSEIKN